MATAGGLADLGVPPEVAKRTGWSIVNVTTTAATQNSAGGLLNGEGNKLVIATLGGSNGAVTLPSAAQPGDIVVVVNTDASNAGLVFPATGGTLQSGTANQSASVAAKAVAICIKATATNWKIIMGAAVTPS